MKKIIAFVIALMCILSLSITVLATDSSSNSEFVVQGSSLNHVTYENIVALYEHWETNGYPDYVGFVYSTDGSSNNLTVLLVEDDGTAENKIRSMLISDAGLSFGSAKYSYNELLAIADEISSEYLEKNNLFYGLGVGWGGAGDGAPGFGNSGKEPRVVVGVDKSILTEYTKKFEKLYGDRVVVFESEAFVREDLRDVTKDKNTGLSWLLIPMMLLVVAGIILFSIRTRLIPAMQTTKGTIITQSVPVSRKETIAAIKNSEVEPSDKVFNSILRRISENDQ
ncbi:MAG TPA: hypothetical protein GXZ76_07015 [Clostridiaceae bacterium]|nr:hypothetical protein [Clostridiaceae bacterium]